MTEPAEDRRQPRRRLRFAAAWVLSAALVAGYFAVGEEVPDAGEAQHMTPSEKPKKAANIDIVEAVPTEATPGNVVELRIEGVDDGPEAAPLRVQLSQGQWDVKRDMEILHRKQDLLVLRVPNEAKRGPAKLRLFQGDKKSKPFDLRVQPRNNRKIYRSIVGGLALLIFGLAMLSNGARAWAGQRSQGLFSRLARRTPGAVGLGVVVGGVTQFTTTAAGLVVGLVESHLLSVIPAVGVLVGAQIGAAATPSILGLASTREGLLVAAVGVLWGEIASDRRSRAFGKMILGVGLLFYGLHNLRVGFEPLVGDPELLPYIGVFDASYLTGLLACALAGAVLAAVLQSPAPVFVLVLGLAESTGRLDLQSALAILSGTGLGAAVATNIVAAPFGRESRQVGRLHLFVALIGTVFLISTVDVWAFVSDTLIGGDPGKIAYGKKVLLPNMGQHIVAGFLISQAAVTVILAATLPALARVLRSMMPPLSDKDSAPMLLGAAGVRALRAGLARVVALQRQGVVAILDLCLSGHRARGVEAEHLLADARAELEGLFAGAVRSRSNEPEIAKLRQAALTTLQLQRVLEDLLRQAERSTERYLALSPAGEAWQVPPRDEANLRALHGLLLEGIEDVIAKLEAGERPDMDQARAREIRLNALEQETRNELLVDADRGEEARAIALRLNSTDLVNAYEAAGNHLYRLCEALAAEVEQIDDDSFITTIRRPKTDL